MNDNLLKYPLPLFHLDLWILIGAACLILETMAVIYGFIGIKISCNRRCTPLFIVILCKELRVLLLRGTWAPWNIIYSSLIGILVVGSLIALRLVDLVFYWQDILEPAVVSWRLGAVGCPAALVASHGQILVAWRSRWSDEIADHLMPRWRGRGDLALSPIVILNFQVGCWAFPLVLNDHLELRRVTANSRLSDAWLTRLHRNEHRCVEVLLGALDYIAEVIGERALKFAVTWSAGWIPWSPELWALLVEWSRHMVRYSNFLSNLLFYL